MTDIGDYLANESVPAQVTAEPSNKKRKRSLTKDDELRQKARFYCKCPEQWRSVSRYSEKRLTEFVQEKEFNDQQQLYDSIFTFALNVIASGLDIVTHGKGHVRTELENDVSLKQAIEQEGCKFIQFLNNKFKIVALIGIDTFNGKRQQMLIEPILETIEEINGGTGGQEDSQDGQSIVVAEDIHTTTTDAEETEGTSQEETI
jgi:hypothetical protein